MFLLRSAFWITVVLLLLPADDQPAQKDAQTKFKPQTITTTQALGAAQETLSDFSGFCERNPSVCIAGETAFEVLQRKAKYAVRIVYNWANSDTLRQSHKPQHSVLNLSEPKGLMLTSNKPEKFLRVSENVRPHRSDIVRPRQRPKRPVSQNTLKIKDLVPTWRGPKPSTRA
jgi:Family of unknown function (DUF5330)